MHWKLGSVTNSLVARASSVYIKFSPLSTRVITLYVICVAIHPLRVLPLDTCTEHGPFEWSMSEGFIFSLSGFVLAVCEEKNVCMEALPISNFSSLSNLDCCIYGLIRCWSSIMLNRLSKLNCNLSTSDKNL